MTSFNSIIKDKNTELVDLFPNENHRLEPEKIPSSSKTKKILNTNKIKIDAKPLLNQCPPDLQSPM